MKKLKRTQNMKTIRLMAFFMAVSSFQYSFAQHSGASLVSPCDNEAVQKKVDSLKKILGKEGYAVLREASLTMQNENEIPIIVPMDEGSQYQFVFIGDSQSNQCEVKMYDYNEKQVMYKRKGRGDNESNIISYSYVPRMSEYHMIRPSQVTQSKKTELCGYVILFRKNTAIAQSAR